MKLRIAKLAAIATVIGLSATAPVEAQPANWPKSMTMGTASIGGVFAVYGQVWANLAADAIKVPISTRQTDGPNHNVILVHGKQVELGMTTMGIALQGWNGTGSWTQGRKFNDIRAIFPMYDTMFHFVALQKSGIKSASQLAGKNLGVGPRAGTPGTYIPQMMEALGIKVSAIRNGGGSDMTSQLGDGLIDTFGFAAGLPFPAFSEAEASNAVTFFTFSPQEIATLRQKMPELSESTIPKGTYKTLTEDQKTLGVYNFAIAHKDLPADLVYGIVKAVMENNPRMVQGHAAAKETLPQNVDKNTFLPFHPGAVRYFEEKGFKIDPKLKG
ncbi:MAG: TAXI family TRAP transporter solute-binding subunit [Alphaproteobacteria bacterium]|nr:TAXI family TRAP transporter solute-binding subunit [Alphaproteobacteria bacterium]